MTFGEKVRKQRRLLKITQEELGQRMGITTRAITSYENDKARPRGLEAYKRLATALELDVNYLLNEDNDFVAEARKKYGTKGAQEAQELVGQLGGLFAGGELSPEDMDAVMIAMQKLYWDAKIENKKYSPKKHRKTKQL